MESSTNIDKYLKNLISKLSFSIREEASDIFSTKSRKKEVSSNNNRILNGRNYIFNLDDVEEAKKELGAGAGLRQLLC
ncbi:MAG: hypothetical protein K8T10_05450 [Candidatus Eremiobacteraeota bacterium]|nr:hypothetical protein [Candidatus Eremiobacteraeota bacterium]